MIDREGTLTQEPMSAEVAGASRILVADDDRLAREHVVALLQRHGFQVEAVEDGQQAVERATKGDIDLVLLDILMPRLNGQEACRLLKGVTGDAFLPVMLVTVKTDTASRVEGLKIGADDFVCKPFDEAELLGRVRALLKVKKLNEHVERAKLRLQHLRARDELTGLFNYRYLGIRLKEEFAAAEARRDAISCMLIDIDQLKTTNEQRGRQAGDEVLRAVARIASQDAGERDVVARFGSDEFLVLLPGTHFSGSIAVAERIWHAAEELAMESNRGLHVRLPLSIGVSYYPSRDVRTKEALLRGADSALHQAKRDGGNRVCVFQQSSCLYTPISGEAVRAMATSQPPPAPHEQEIERLRVEVNYAPPGTGGKRGQ